MFISKVQSSFRCNHNQYSGTINPALYYYYCFGKCCFKQLIPTGIFQDGSMKHLILNFLNLSDVHRRVHTPADVHHKVCPERLRQTDRAFFFRSLRLKRCVCSLCRLWPCTPRWGSPAPPRSSTPRRWSTCTAPPSSAPSPCNSREPWQHQGSCFTDTDRKSQHTVKTTLNPTVPEEPWSR